MKLPVNYLANNVLRYAKAAYKADNVGDDFNRYYTLLYFEQNAKETISRIMDAIKTEKISL